jgi:hypothetical protein
MPRFFVEKLHHVHDYLKWCGVLGVVLDELHLAKDAFQPN